jgi:hypothetical protein
MMDDPADLLRHAERYRTLATRVTDEPTRIGLLELAQRYEALAAEMQGEGKDPHHTTLPAQRRRRPGHSSPPVADFA